MLLEEFLRYSIYINARVRMHCLPPPLSCCPAAAITHICHTKFIQGAKDREKSWLGKEQKGPPFQIKD
jgi:hypothetical protein